MYLIKLDETFNPAKALRAITHLWLSEAEVYRMTFWQTALGVQ